MRRILWKSCSLLAGLAMGCFGKDDTMQPTPDYGVWDSSYRDVDGDGWPADVDCDDDDDSIHPEATELCDDGVDNDCDEAIDADDDDCSA
jgi:hypothetical protein